MNLPSKPKHSHGLRMVFSLPGAASDFPTPKVPEGRNIVAQRGSAG